MNLLLALLQAIAVITSPQPNEVVLGLVNITGAASHPQFVRYELAFAYDPNPADTWFELQPPSETQVTEGLLAVWDTTSITDGTYMIRLRVYSSDSDRPQEMIARGIKIQNTPLPTAVPTLPSVAGEAATPTLVLPTATFAPTPAVASLPTTPSAPAASGPSFDPSPFTSAFCNGVYLAFGVFIFLGLYTALRDRIRRPILRWLKRIISDSKKP